jgi:hypothetical protein
MRLEFSPDLLREPKVYQDSEGYPIIEQLSVDLPNGQKAKPSQFGSEQFGHIIKQLDWTQKAKAGFSVDYHYMQEVFKRISRRSGGPYFNHLKNVCLNVFFDLEETDPVIARVALLHDLIEEVSRLNESGPISYKPDSLVNPYDFYVELMRSETIAKAVMALTKPKYQKPKSEMSDLEMMDYDFNSYARIINAYPEVSVIAAKVKVADRKANLDTMALDSEERQAKYLLESIIYLTSIAEHAGEQAQQVFRNVVSKYIELLTLQQKLDARPVKFN